MVAKKSRKHSKSKSKSSIKITSNKKLKDSDSFHFNSWNGDTGIKAQTVEEFKSALKKVPIDSLYFHLRDDQNDFAAWFKAAFSDEKRAKHMEVVKSEMLEGEHLRRALYFHL